jgi:hypothetical protein
MPKRIQYREFERDKVPLKKLLPLPFPREGGQGDGLLNDLYKAV